MSMADGWRMAMCLWQTVGDDSYFHVRWFKSMMVGEKGYWLCPWQMVGEEDGSHQEVSEEVHHHGPCHVCVKLLLGIGLIYQKVYYLSTGKGR
jgi:hypothetical protein